ncbi:MAG: rhodanese-like domain-containing protein [Gammaproteobacteria bacterium]
MELTLLQLVSRAMERITEVSVDDFESNRLDDAVVIDVREPDEHQEGHIPGSVNIPRGVLEAEVDTSKEMNCKVAPELQNRKRPIYLYCRTGGRSALAADALQQMGFTNVLSLAGGMVAWNDWQKNLWRNG